MDLLYIHLVILKAPQAGETEHIHMYIHVSQTAAVVRGQIARGTTKDAATASTWTHCPRRCEGTTSLFRRTESLSPAG